MILIEHGNRFNVMLRAAGYFATLTLLYSPLPGFLTSDAWGQQSPTQLNSPARAQAEPRRHVAPRPAPAAQPSFSQPSALNLTPIAFPLPNPETALGPPCCLATKRRKVISLLLCRVRGAKLNWTNVIGDVITNYAASMRCYQRHNYFSRIIAKLSRQITRH